MQLFHYHLVTSRVREVEARYIGKLAFDLIARHGRIGEDLTSYEPGVAWSELYDLQEDPHALVNRWDDPGARDALRAMQDRLLHEMIAVSETSPRPSALA